MADQTSVILLQIYDRIIYVSRSWTLAFKLGDLSVLAHHSDCH